MKDFKVNAAIGEESQTDQFFVDAAGVKWPIYSKKLAVAALGATAAVNVAHGITAPKLDGHLRVRSLTCSSGTAGATARTNENSAGISFSFTSTNLVITDTADLSAQSGQVTIEYCKTTDTGY